MSQPLYTIVTLLLQLVQCSQLISTLKIVQSSLNFCYMVLEWFHSFFFGCTWLLWRLQSFLSSGRYSSNILTRGNSLHLDTMWSPPVSLHSSIFTIFWRFILLHSQNAYCKIMYLKKKRIMSGHTYLHLLSCLQLNREFFSKLQLSSLFKVLHGSGGN